MFKALLLDVDGTLVDTYAAENCAINATLAQVDWLGGIDTTEFALEWRMQRKRHPTYCPSHAIVPRPSRVVDREPQIWAEMPP